MIEAGSSTDCCGDGLFMLDEQKAESVSVFSSIKRPEVFIHVPGALFTPISFC